MAAYTGHQNTYRRLTKRDRMEFGHEYAPEFVAPPRNECELCHAPTILRYYRNHDGWVCESCRDLPAICTTNASQVHRGCYYVPLGIFEEATSAPVAAQEALQDAIRRFDAKQAEKRWHEARKAGEARRGAVVARLA
jgi:hypothetical protein